MIILCTSKEAEKKLLKKAYKIYVTDIIPDDCEEKKRVHYTREFLPDPITFSNYINGYTNKKQYRKEYIDNIKENETLFSSLLCILILYRRGDKVCLVCDESEIQFKYLEFLAQFINERYGIKIITYKDAKKIGDLDDIKNKMPEKGYKKLEKDIKKHKHILGEAAKQSKGKKKKKKKDKHKKNKKHSKDKMMDELALAVKAEQYSQLNSKFDIVKIKPLYKKINKI